MTVRPGKKYQQFERALKYFIPNQITALYNDLGRHECKIIKEYSRYLYYFSAWQRWPPGVEEWPLEFCIRKAYFESAHYLIDMGLPQEELNCGLKRVLKKHPDGRHTQLIKTLLKAGASLKSIGWLEEFSNHYQFRPQQSSEVLRSLCSIPTDPAIRFLIQGMFLHYCCIGSCRCQHYIYTEYCIAAERLVHERSAFNATWYKTLEYLISEGLDLSTYMDQTVVEATDQYYSDCRTRYPSLTPHMDTSVMSIMIRLATGSTFSRNMFAQYSRGICGIVRRSCSRGDMPENVGGHERSSLDLLPMFYQVGVDVCASDSRLIFTGPRVEQYMEYITFLKEQPRSLRELARLRTRLALSGPNLMISSQALTDLPTSIQHMIMLKDLDITRSLEPESVSWCKYIYIYIYN